MLIQSRINRIFHMTATQLLKTLDLNCGQQLYRIEATAVAVAKHMVCTNMNKRVLGSFSNTEILDVEPVLHQLTGKEGGKSDNRAEVRTHILNRADMVQTIQLFVQAVKSWEQDQPCSAFFTTVNICKNIIMYALSRPYAEV